VLVVGVKGLFDLSPQGTVVRQLKQTAADLSTRLGYSLEKMDVNQVDAVATPKKAKSEKKRNTSY